jgi:hypothetical protein
MNGCTNGHRSELRRIRPVLRSSIVIAAIVALAVFISAPAMAANAPVAFTNSGIVRGVSTPEVNEFLGIRYAVLPCAHCD